MADDKQKKEELIKCVSELDIDEETKGSILDSIRKGKSAMGIRLLRQYRGEILNDLHSDQNRLYQIDYVLQKAK
mgnify:CR=1 FL=1